jgi:predicted nucleotidyltransferase
MTTSISEQAIIATLQAELPTLLAVYLFGSYAQGTAGPASDLDLAVLVAGKLEPLCLWELAQTLAAQAGCDVDLLDLRAASTVMQYQIITSGTRLWEKDAQAALFESAILSEKTALDTARAGLLSDIQREGTVYGR